MIFIKEMVPAAQIWPNSRDYTDRGYIAGYVRGYNAEILKNDGTTGWLSCEWIDTDPELHYDSEYYRWRCEQYGWKFTGRFSFRGYGIEKYDPEFNETYIERVED
jgi:hypothetical protein